jgi:hypothetical protein
MFDAVLFSVERPIILTTKARAAHADYLPGYFVAGICRAPAQRQRGRAARRDPGTPGAAGCKVGLPARAATAPRGGAAVSTESAGDLFPAGREFVSGCDPQTCRTPAAAVRFAPGISPTGICRAREY